MIKSMFKKKHAKRLTVILTIIIIGFIYFNNDSYHQIKRKIVKEIEVQIAEMEANGTDGISYYNGCAYVNHIEGKKFMIKIIKRLKPNRISDLIPTFKKPSQSFAQIGDIDMGYNGSYSFYPYGGGHTFNMREKDYLAFKKFVSELEQRK